MMTEEMHEDENICVLVDEEGKEWEFEIVDVFEKDDKRYALLIPANEEANDDEETGIFLRIEQDENGDDIFEDLEDDEFDAVSEYYETLLEEDDDDEE